MGEGSFEWVGVGESSFEWVGVGWIRLDLIRLDWFVSSHTPIPYRLLFYLILV